MILKCDFCGICHLAKWEKTGYYIDTKRWYRWSRKPRSSWKTGSKGGLSPLFRWHKFLRNHIKGIVPEAIQMKQKVASTLQKARLTNDRTQQFREITLGSYTGCVTGRGLFHLSRSRLGAIFCFIKHDKLFIKCLNFSPYAWYNNITEMNLQISEEKPWLL